MKKVFYIAASLFVFMTILSCSKEDIEGTAMESMAGQWYCTIDAVDNDGITIKNGEDYFGLEGRTIVLTYNVAANNSSQMWVNIMGVGNFAKDYNYPGYPDYDFCSIVNCNQEALTFSSTEATAGSSLTQVSVLSSLVSSGEKLTVRSTVSPRLTVRFIPLIRRPVIGPRTITGQTAVQDPA